MVHGHNCYTRLTYAPFRKITKILFLSLTLLAVILLNGCSTTRRDGPPPFDVDVSKIPDATPKSEPLSKFGNMAAYRVNGQYYYPLKTAKGYEERGIASWYGMRFHALRTSSGERYNLLAMTAAHKTLPLPTYVQVTNLHNGKKVIVKVNDRGPFASNRIIDLSYVAAKKLGMLGHGTAYVDVKAIDPNHIPSDVTLIAHNKTKQKSFASNSTHLKPTYLQVGAFKHRIYAERLKRKLIPMVASHVQVARVRHAFVYRVQIGPIRDVATADNITKKLRALGLNPMR